MPFPLDENPNIFTAEQKASNESTCEKLIGIEDKDQYPVCPKPYIFDIQNRVSDYFIQKYDFCGNWAKF